MVKYTGIESKRVFEALKTDWISSKEFVSMTAFFPKMRKSECVPSTWKRDANSVVGYANEIRNFFMIIR